MHAIQSAYVSLHARKVIEYSNWITNRSDQIEGDPIRNPIISSDRISILSRISDRIKESLDPFDPISILLQD